MSVSYLIINLFVYLFNRLFVFQEKKILSVQNDWNTALRLVTLINKKKKMCYVQLLLLYFNI